MLDGSIVSTGGTPHTTGFPMNADTTNEADVFKIFPNLRGVKDRIKRPGRSSLKSTIHISPKFNIINKLSGKNVPVLFYCKARKRYGFSK
jgi:hypothetical protein